MKYMKFFSLLFVAFLFVWGFTDVKPEGAAEETVAADTSEILRPSANHFREVLVINSLLNQYHFRKVTMGDSLSSVIFDRYINALDPNKEYFFASDLEYFEKYRYSLDDELSKGKLDIGFQIFRVYKERAKDRIAYAFQLLENEPDYSIEEELEYNRDSIAWAGEREELDDYWRKKIKGYALNLKLRNKEWEDTKEVLDKRYKNFEKTLRQYNSNDVFEIYMNAYTGALDPHTSYFSPVSSDRFKVNMSHSLEGIGARLVQDVDFTKVYEVVPGGPAFKSKDIFKDDLIVGVAQGEKGEFVDVVGWRLDEVVEKIKGPKGTVVKLLLLRKGASVTALPDTIQLVRDKIKLEEQDAKAEVVPFKDGDKTFNLGVITIPDFYISFEDVQKGVKDYKSLTRDVKKLLIDLEEKGIDGLMIDLRNNGGGALQEAIELTGLFIPDGPVVQVKKTSGDVDIERDTDKAVYYDGPLAVLLNRYSASASEIFAGAIQDYERGVIIGETTFGKGSVQNLVGLSQFLPKDDTKMGQLKLTLAKYYRITGSSTQNVGVVPDVIFPSPYDPEEFGESSEANALPWDMIASSKFKTQGIVSSELLSNLNHVYATDLERDKDLLTLVKNVERARELRGKTKVSLHYETRKAEMEAEKEEGIADDLDEEEAEEEEDASADEELEVKLKKDTYLKQSLRILSEMVRQQKIG